MEWLKKSLVVKIFSLFFIGLVLIFAIAGWGVLQFNESITQHQNLLNKESKNALIITQANLEFKRQVQEWKNVLIRGSDSNQLNKYWGKFEAQEKKIQTLVEGLKKTFPWIKEQVDNSTLLALIATNKFT